MVMRATPRRVRKIKFSTAEGLKILEKRFEERGAARQVTNPGEFYGQLGNAGQRVITKKEARQAEEAKARVLRRRAEPTFSTSVPIPAGRPPQLPKTTRAIPKRRSR
jgi:hypothetical protein